MLSLIVAGQNYDTLTSIIAQLLHAYTTRILQEPCVETQFGTRFKVIFRQIQFGSILHCTDTMNIKYLLMTLR